MNKIKIIIILVILAGLGFIFYFLNPDKAKVFDPKNATYEIDGQMITLKNGQAESEVAPGSVSKITTSYFGNEAVGDLNFDGQDDMAYLLVQEGGGTGVFFFVVAAIKNESGYKITNAFFVGDRIAPQSTEIISNELRVNYAERKPDEPFTAEPSVGAVLLLKVTPAGVLEGLMK